MNEEISKLITDNLGLAYDLAFKYNRKLGGYMELDEIVSICMLALVEAGRTFNPDKGIQFSTYSYTVMKNEVVRQYLKLKNRATISLNTPISNESTNDITLQDIIPDTNILEDIFTANIESKELHTIISELPEDEMNLVYARLNGKTLKEISKILNCNYSVLTARYNKIMNKLRYKYLRNGGGERFG